ncbi:MAG: SDR family oxidoreductase [Acidimicrobiia bacterium]|nr:SDR family oxidoreductase [Acidimicrobiia bacterium]
MTESPRRSTDARVPRAVVTGAAGFLGSHLSERLVGAGWDVVGLDNLLTGRMENLEALLPHERFTFEHYDVTNFVDVAGAVDAVLHFASPASPVDYLEYPIKTMKVGALGTHNMLGLALAKGAKFFLASTSEVYGDPQVHPQTEDYWGHVNPIGPRGVYDEAKRFAEALTLAYHRSHGLDVRISRIFNTYGPRLRPADGRVVSNFLFQAMRGEPLTVYGDGKQSRSFCFVDDEISGIVALLDSDYVGPVNIGNPNEFTILELAETVIEVTGSTSKMVFEDLPVDDPTQRKPDISLARSLFDWEPTVQLREGLERTCLWYKAELEARGE